MAEDERVIPLPFSSVPLQNSCSESKLVAPILNIISNLSQVAQFPSPLPGTADMKSREVLGGEKLKMIEKMKSPLV